MSDFAYYAEQGYTDINSQDIPTPDITFDDRYEFSLGGLDVVLIAAEGAETNDSLVIWLPQHKICLTGNIFSCLFGHIPNLVTIRGDRYRDAITCAAAAQTELAALRAVKTPSWRRPLQRSRCRRYRPLLMTRAGVPDDEQDERQVAPLEEHHVNESFMRYGTLPKGAHIGAFLDSLRESGLRGSAEGGEAAAGAAGEARALRSHTEAEGVRPPASAAAAKKPSAMVRSNSSNSEFQRPRLSRLSPLVFAGAAGTGPARSRRPEADRVKTRL